MRHIGTPSKETDICIISIGHLSGTELKHTVAVRADKAVLGGLILNLDVKYVNLEQRTGSVIDVSLER